MPLTTRFLRFLCLLFACSASISAQETAELTFPVFSFNVSSPIVSLPFKIKDAEFSSSLNAIVAVSQTPNQLHIYRPETNELVSVNLQVPPTCVSVSPDGHSAVAGHDAWISHVNLDNGTLLQTIQVSAVISDIVLGGNDFAYAFAQGSFVPVYSINLTTGVQSQSQSSIFGGNVARRHPGGQSMYGADTAASPADIEKYSIANDVAQVAYDSPYHGDYPMCGNLWLSVDGQRIYTACGRVFRASSDFSQDMRYVGSFSTPVSIQWAEHTQTGSSIAILPQLSSAADGEIRYFTPDFLLYRGAAMLPRFVVGEATWAAQGRWLFFNAAGTKQYVVVQADTAANITSDFGLVTVDCTNASITLDPTSASFESSFTTAQFAVTGSPGCGWTSVSNAAWVNTNSSGVGDGIVTYTVSANTGVAPRNGTITVGGATFTVSQEGVNPTSLVATATSPTAVSLSWMSAVSVDHFEVWRSSGGAFTLVGTPVSNAFTDSTTASTGYVYEVRSVAAGGAMSDFSAPDYAHTFTLTDPVVSAGMTIKAAHVTELRSAINAMRNAAGIAPATFTDGSLQFVTVKRAHIIELRDAIQALRASLAMPAVDFSSLPLNDWVRASRIEELRAAMR